MIKNYVQALRVMPRAHFKSLHEMPRHFAKMPELFRHYV